MRRNHSAHVWFPIAVVFTLLAASLPAQILSRGGGCTVPAGGLPGVVDTENELPVLGNLSFHMCYSCPAPADSVFVLLGRCEYAAELPLFPFSPCGMSCGRVVKLDGATLSGIPVNPDTRLATWSFPIPNIVLFTDLSLCVQFLCFDLSGPAPTCQEISQGVELTLL